MRLTVATLLKAAGHETVVEGAAVTITDNAARSTALAVEGPTLVLASVTEIAAAVDAMHQGVFGYIFVPLKPGELELMVRRAAESSPALGAPEFEPRPLAEVEHEHILAVLRHCNYNRTEAARLLGIGRNTLWRKLRALEQEDSRR
jgi:DNA-binding NtrC family response regulator